MASGGACMKVGGALELLQNIANMPPPFKKFPLLPPGARCNWGTHSAVAGLEARDPLLGAGELLRGHNGLQNLEDVVPEGVVLLAEQDNDAGRLSVEGRGDVEDDLLRDLGNLLVRDGHVLVEGVDGAAGLDRLEESLGSHSCWWCRKGPEGVEGSWSRCGCGCGCESWSCSTERSGSEAGAFVPTSDSHRLASHL